MTLAEEVSGPGRAGLLEKLMAAVRPEFRVDVLIPDPDDPVLGVKPCQIVGCGRPHHLRGLCSAHLRRWYQRGRPDLHVFVADPGPPMRGRRELDSCLVEGCRYGLSGHGLCRRHGQQWGRAGRPDLAAWTVAARLPRTRGDRLECHLPYCSLWAEFSGSPFCNGHTTRWRNAGKPEIEEFIAACGRYATAFIDFGYLPPQLRLEFQYAVQCRSDERSVPAPPRVLCLSVRNAAKSGVTSLLELSEEGWEKIGIRRRRSGQSGPTAGVDAFLFYARDAVETLRDGAGWEVEFQREVWRLGNLPGLNHRTLRSRPRSRLRFDQITQPWLKVLAKRWVRRRLVSGLSVGAAFSDVVALIKLSEFLTATVPDAGGLTVIDRPFLERFMAWLPEQSSGTTVNDRRVGSLHAFFQAIRQHGWDDTLPATAVFVPGDFPRRRRQVTRFLAEHVMAQIEQPANLDRWAQPEGRVITSILIQGGLRISSVVRLPFDCLLHDGQGAPYLRYHNTKMEREAAVPINDELEAQIRDQQRRVLERWPQGNPNLFPRPQCNADGRFHLCTDTYRKWLYRWLKTCDVRDELGRPVHLTPHQWRHTFATRLINRDVPQEVIRVLLDHESTRMTAHYAKITEQTVRRHWEQATKVNINGERVSIAPDGPLAQAQWAKTRYAMATQTLSNGYCGLPIQKSCPHANACLTCPVFITGPEFLPELRQQRHRTLTLVEVSEGNRQTRVAEMNKQVLTNLDRMISEIEKDNDNEATDAG